MVSMSSIQRRPPAFQNTHRFWKVNIFLVLHQYLKQISQVHYMSILCTNLQKNKRQLRKNQQPTYFDKEAFDSQIQNTKNSLYQCMKYINDNVDSNQRVNNLFSIIGETFARNESKLVNQHKRMQDTYINEFLKYGYG